MTEVSSRWVLQEVFVDSSLEEKSSDCTLNLSVSSEVVEKRGNLYKVAVELSGSIVGEFQVANVRFVNVSVVEVKPGTRRATVLKRLEKAKEGELLSILPIYLLNAGIFLKEVRREL